MRLPADDCICLCNVPEDGRDSDKKEQEDAEECRRGGEDVEIRVACQQILTPAHECLLLATRTCRVHLATPETRAILGDRSALVTVLAQAASQSDEWRTVSHSSEALQQLGSSTMRMQLTPSAMLRPSCLLRWPMAASNGKQAHSDIENALCSSRRSLSVVQREDQRVQCQC